MTSTAPTSLGNIAEREIVPGFHARMVHSETMTFAYWRIEKGSQLPEHSHPHEQVVNMLEGEFELVLDGVSHHLVAGDVLVIPSNVPHSGNATGAARILDVFCPCREDYR